MKKQYNVVISGSEGYIGCELINLVANHPFLHLYGIHSRQNLSYKKNTPFKKCPLVFFSLEELIQHASQIDILLLATPASASMEIVAALADSKIILIDLSAAFRLPKDQFIKWYGQPHTAPEYLKEACYGLVPFVSNQNKHRLIANPGCYATCALLSILPLLQANLLHTASVIIDAKSGVSGAGKQPNPALQFCEVADNFLPYKVGIHQHTPEIKNTVLHITGNDCNLRLTTSLLPITRGISMTIYTEARPTFCSDEAIATAVQKAYDTAYAKYALVCYKAIGNPSHANPTPLTAAFSKVPAWQKEDEFILSLKNVVRTPFTHIGYFIKDGFITLFSSIDNLLKGAASQAIENINSFLNLPLETGLLPEGVVL